MIEGGLSQIGAIFTREIAVPATGFASAESGPSDLHRRRFFHGIGGGSCWIGLLYPGAHGGLGTRRRGNGGSGVLLKQ
jgi:hypothetical protein